MKLTLSGLNNYRKKTEKQKARIKQGAANYIRANVRAVLKDLVLNTPQWSGDTAASWRIDLNYLPASDSPSALAVPDWNFLNPQSSEYQGTPPRFLGDTAAWAVAKAEAEGPLKAIRYNSVVRIVNTAPYAGELAVRSEDELKLRKGNFIPGDVMAVKYVSAKYKLGSNLVGMQLKSVMDYD